MPDKVEYRKVTVEDIDRIKLDLRHLGFSEDEIMVVKYNTYNYKIVAERL